MKYTDIKHPETIEWGGKTYPTPSKDELDAMLFGRIPCTTPDGEEVDAIHPDSWPSLLHMI